MSANLFHHQMDMAKQHNKNLYDLNNFEDCSMHLSTGTPVVMQTQDYGLKSNISKAKDTYYT